MVKPVKLLKKTPWKTMESSKSLSSLCEWLNAPSRSLRGARDVLDKVVGIFFIKVIVQSIHYL